jgi:hypothetical protein
MMVLKEGFGWAAEIVAVFHFVVVLFILAGGILIRWWGSLAWLHIPLLSSTILLHLTGWVCPLTLLENALRIRASGSGYTGSFIQHYIFALLNIGQGTRALETGIGVLLLISNIVLYVSCFRRKRDFLERRLQDQTP